MSAQTNETPASMENANKAEKAALFKCFSACYGLFVCLLLSKSCSACTIALTLNDRAAINQSY
jgi:hypothetical protein